MIPIPVFLEAKELVSQQTTVADTSLVGIRGGIKGDPRVNPSR